MFAALRALISRWISPPPAPVSDDAPPAARIAVGHPVPYDENLLEKSRTQWQFGDWQSLAQLQQDQIEHHPDRAKLALLAAVGRLQISADAEARQYVRLAQNWGAGKKLVSQILIGGVYNSLGKAAALCGQKQRALGYFETSAKIGGSSGDIHLFARIRTSSQFAAACLNKTGEFLYAQRKYKLASEYFYRALNIARNSAWYCQNLAEAIARLDIKKDDPWEVQPLADHIAATGKWDLAVRHYRQALKLDAGTVAAHKQQQSFEIAPVTKQTIANPVFIVGCGHSGTSLMLAMVGNHPCFYPIPKESALFLQTDATINRTMAQWDQDCANQDKARWAEKTPPHIFQIHRFLAFRPRSQFLLMLRDGRDVVCSLKARQGYARIEDRIDRWAYDNLAGLPYWQHPQIKVIKYENLIADPETELRAICRFLGEDYSPALLEYYKTEHLWYSDKISKPEAIRTLQDHNDNRNWQINQPLFDGRGRWKKDMSEEDKNRFKQSPAQDYLERFGYVMNQNW